jgi:hypothetical protein
VHKENKKTIFNFFRKRKANWPSTAQRGHGPSTEAAHGGGVHARWRFSKNTPTLNGISMTSTRTIPKGSNHAVKPSHFLSFATGGSSELPTLAGAAAGGTARYASQLGPAQT